MTFPNDYTNYDQITIDHAKIGSGGVSNVDVWIPIDLLSTTARATLKSDGSDARFTLDDGITQLPGHPFLNASGNLIGFKCRISTLSDSSDSTIRLWYNGNDNAPAVSDTYGQYAVYSSAIKVSMNFEQDPSGTSPQIIDYTSNQNHGSSSNMAGGDLVTGRIGNALSFNGTNGKVTITVNTSLNFSAAYTFRFWVYINALPSYDTLMSILCNFDTDSNHGGFDVRLYNNAGTQEIDVVVEGRGQLSVFQTLSAGQWHHFCLIYDGSSALELFIDNLSVGSVSVGTIQSNTKDLNIGAFGYGTFMTNEAGRWFSGKLDQLHMQASMMTSAERITRYNNESDPSSFFLNITASNATTTGGASSRKFPVIGSTIIHGCRSW